MPTIKIDCLQCGAGIDVPDSRVGTEITCPACGQKFVAIVRPRKTAVERNAIKAEIQRDHTAKREQRNSAAGLTGCASVIFCVAGIIALIGIVIGIFALPRPGIVIIASSLNIGLIALIGLVICRR